MHVLSRRRVRAIALLDDGDHALHALQHAGKHRQNVKITGVDVNFFIKGPPSGSRCAPYKDRPEPPSLLEAEEFPLPLVSNVP